MANPRDVDPGLPWQGRRGPNRLGNRQRRPAPRHGFGYLVKRVERDGASFGVQNVGDVRSGIRKHPCPCQPSCFAGFVTGPGLDVSNSNEVSVFDGIRQRSREQSQANSAPPPIGVDLDDRSAPEGPTERPATGAPVAESLS